MQKNLIGLYRQLNMKFLIVLCFVFLTPVSFSKDLLNNELDLLISKIPYKKNFNQITAPELAVPYTDIFINQTGSTNQIVINHSPFKNTITTHQNGSNNVVNINIFGSENTILTKQVGEVNDIHIHHNGNHSLTQVEQYGNYNQVIFNTQETNQISYIKQTGNNMTAIIQNGY